MLLVRSRNILRHYFLIMGEQSDLGANVRLQRGNNAGGGMVAGLHDRSKNGSLKSVLKLGKRYLDMHMTVSELASRKQVHLL